MIARLASRLRRFGREDSGLASLEFVMIFPFFTMLMLSSIEASFMTMRQVSLERGLDVAMRDVRLGTGLAPTHAQIKDRVCAGAGLLPDCDSALRLEMRPVPTRNFTGFSTDADCVDRAEEINPVRQFTPGLDNQLMIVRACVVIDPVFPSTGLALRLPKDDTGGYKLISASAFVQEPQ